MEVRDILIYLSIKYKGDFEKIYSAIITKEEVDYNKVDEVISSLKHNAITIIDDNYPDLLKQTYKPPIVLYYYGDIDIINNRRKLGVIGTRHPSEYGSDVTQSILNDVLKEDITIVSGLAIGIDSLSHQCALKNNKKTIAVLANGLDSYYLDNNINLFNSIKEKGLILTEYPMGVKLNKDNFKVRNRIIAGLSKAIFVPEANKKSGTSITIKYALEMDREIMCVPSSIFNKESLTNFLLKQGAKIVLNSEDILEEI